MSQLRDQLHTQRAVTGHVVGVGILVGTPRSLVECEQGAHTVAAGLLPTPDRVGLADDIDLGAVGGEHLPQDRFQSWIGHQGHRMPEHDAR